MLTVGRDSRWWNRKIRLRMKPILLMVGSVLGIALLYGFLGEVVESGVWSITHRSTATYKGWPGTKFEGFSVKAPWMWRQGPGLGSDQEIKLVRARVGSPIAPDLVLISRVDSPEDKLKHLGTPDAEGKFAKAGIPFHAEPFPIDPDVANHFSCIATHIGKITTNPIHCASTDGRRWMVTYLHFNETNEIDLNPILRNLQ